MVDMIKYSYEIHPRPPELGGGWKLCLLEDGEEVGCGVFPISFYDDSCSIEDALKFAYSDAMDEGNNWLASKH